MTVFRLTNNINADALAYDTKVFYMKWQPSGRYLYYHWSDGRSNDFSLNSAANAINWNQWYLVGTSVDYTVGYYNAYAIT